MAIQSHTYPFTEAYIALAPERAGVYALYDGTKVIYYGRALGGSVTIRSRLSDHKSGREGRCTQSASRFNWEVCSNPKNREMQLLEEHRRIYGRLPRCNERVG